MVTAVNTQSFSIHSMTFLLVMHLHSVHQLEDHSGWDAAFLILPSCAHACSKNANFSYEGEYISAAFRSCSAV